MIGQILGHSDTIVVGIHTVSPVLLRSMQSDVCRLGRPGAAALQGTRSCHCCL
jgi:hypothetical protein